MRINNNRLCWMADLLKSRFGCVFFLEQTQEGLILKIPNQPGKIVFDCLENIFMQGGEPVGLGCEHYYITAPLKFILGEKFLPAPTSKPLRLPIVERENNTTKCHYDILGFAFWMLNRLEEIGRKEEDMHGRFPASESHAFQHGYLQQPLVDEWLHILQQVVVLQWPQLQLKRHTFRQVVSHDVDSPARYSFKSIGGTLRAIGGDIVKRHTLKSAFIGSLVKLGARDALHPLDPYNTFEWIMDQSDKRGLKSTFNFICETGYGRFEPDYNLEHPAIKRLIRRIYERGHFIGLHPSYDSYKSPEKIAAQFNKLKITCDLLGVSQERWGGRMHYLKWSHPETIIGWEQAGLDYDSTLSYASQAGFRCGTCFEYTPYSCIDERVLNIKELPLIAMEGSVLAKKYMAASSHAEALSIFSDLKEKCRKVGGQFTLLWHNSEFTDPDMKKLYNEVLGK